MKLNDVAEKRWQRQINIPQFGVESQIKLLNSTVLLCGVGGVGCTAALYLAAAGVGKMIIVDCDTVELSNLNRQIIYGEPDIGKAKVQLAAERLHALNPDLALEVINEYVEKEKLKQLVQGCTFVIDTFDRNKSRFDVNETCVHSNIPVSHAFAQDMSGEIITVLPYQSPCLHCVMDENYPEITATPVLGVAAGLVGIQLAATAVKYITGCGIVKAGSRLIWDLAMDQSFTVPLKKEENCPVCSVLCSR